MSVQISIWNDDKAQEEIRKHLRAAQKDRNWVEPSWRRNERIIYSTTAPHQSLLGERSVDFSVTDALSAGVDQSNADVNVAYTFKNFRFIHAQMSANPPSVAMRPTSSDQDDHRKADAADRIVRWALRHYSLQEKQDQMNLNTLLYGTGILKTIWDSTKGDILSVDEETGKMNLEGDIDISVPFIWNMYIDPDGKNWEDIKWVMEKIYLDYEEACFRWPEKKDILKKSMINEEDVDGNEGGRRTELRNAHYNSVQLVEYWETGLPSNGYLGRYCITTLDGEIVQSCRPSPFRFRQAGAVNRIEGMDLPEEVKAARIARLPEKARLPYCILTDIDVPNRVWGMSAIEYAAQLQDNLSRLDSSVLDTIQAHGNVRMVLPESAEISDDSLSNTNWDVLKITGNQPPYFINPPALMSDIPRFRGDQITGINDVMGVNESMFGQQSREQSGASMQYATNQGNMVRRRLFNKYVMAVEALYRNILGLVRKHWTVDRTIHVIGKEKALEAIDIKGADIDGGYDVIGEYGVTLSLDPITRREEILTLQPLFEKAGIPVRSSLRMLKLNELEGMFDDLDKAQNRQKEIFDRMIATGTYIPPKKFRDHENMIAWAMGYFMSQEFEALPEEAQALCEQHIEERAKVAASEKPAPPPAPAPAGAPAEGGLPAPGGLPLPPGA